MNRPQANNKRETATKIAIAVFLCVVVIELIFIAKVMDGTSFSLNGGGANTDYSSYRDLAQADESYFEWEENTITALTEDGKVQTIIIIPARCEKIEEGVFTNASLQYLFFEDDDDVDITGAFKEADDLIYAELPSGLTGIGDYAFWYCTSLLSITIPDGTVSIGDYAFQWCTSLSEVTFGEGLKYIGERTFWECSEIEGVTLPDSLKSIGNFAFYSGLETADISSETETAEYSFPGSTAISMR